MKPNPLLQLAELGQSIWLDLMRRSLVTSGTLQKLIREDGLRGLTSNPTIFEKAIAESDEYSDSLRMLAAGGATASQIYEALVVDDISRAADVFADTYRATDGKDGYPSLEVSPLLAHDTQGTIAEAKALFTKLGRPNVMIKIPATPEGIPAIEESIAAGININVTLIFSVEVYQRVAEAYLRGLERRAQAGQSVNIASVASFFVSRIDVAVDKQLNARLEKTTDPTERERINALLGKAGIANAKIAYASFKKIFGSPRFLALKNKGARVQRPLWASTGTKNPKYSDVMYVEALIGADTVNTLPPQTMDAFRDHGKAAPTLEQDVAAATSVFASLKAFGVDFGAITDELTRNGVELFSESFKQLMTVIEARRDETVTTILERHTANLGTFAKPCSDALHGLDQKKVVSRIWQHDPTVWTAGKDHEQIIRNALGWLTVPDLMAEQVDALEAFAEEVLTAGFQHAVVLGMGGSSLCPEVFRQTFGKRVGYPELMVLDSTVPASIRRLEQHINVERTLFMVASKSGTTTEPQMFYRYFFDRVKQRRDNPGANFIAITDPKTQLQSEAERDGFRRVFVNPADIGGRYSALSYFGLVPLAVMGGDVRGLLTTAQHAVHSCVTGVAIDENPGARLGAALGTLQLAGRDKLTLITPEPIASLGLWIEQLIAESTGKEGKGIVPIAGEPLGPPEVYGNDRVFCYIRTKSGISDDIEGRLAALEKAGHPVLRSVLRDPLDLGEEFFIWEFATAVAGSIMGIDAFDQPNVQESKDNTKRLLAEFTQRGAFPQQEVIVTDGALRVFSDDNNLAALRRGSSGSLADVLAEHLRRVRPGDYFALTEYIEESSQYDELIQQLRVAIRKRTAAATTTGYGPRFLHSTGQLHKGGPDSGVFIQMTCEDEKDIEIPGERFTFGALKQAQALGDFQSLSNRNRRAIRVDLGRDVEAGLQRVLDAIRGVVPQEKAKAIA